jgi:hypothetical protein
MADVELYNTIIPLLVDEYNKVGFKTGMKLDDFLQLRFTELSANELRFPGAAEHYMKKIKMAQKISLISVLFGIGSVVLHLMR